MGTYNGSDKRLQYLFNHGGGGGSTVTITPTLSSGTKIADFSINGVSDELYAPSGGGGSGIDYSLGEQDTGLHWIDGKPIYQQTIYLASLPNNSTANLSTPSNIETLVEMKGFAYSTVVSGNYRPLPFSAGGSNDIRIDMANGVLRLITFTAWTNYSAYITVQYTKTTD